MKDSVKNPNGIPSDYRAAECIEDFKAGDIVYWKYMTSTAEQGMVLNVDQETARIQVQWFGSERTDEHGISGFDYFPERRNIHVKNAFSFLESRLDL